MATIIRTVMLTVTLALLSVGSVTAQDTAETAVGLEMDRALGARSREKIADGSASQGQSRLTQETTGISSTLLLGGLALALAGFAAGALIARREPKTEVADAPVALWLDAEKLQADLEELESELGKQQHSNEELAYEREQLLIMHADELHELRGEKEELIREVKALHLRGDGSEDNNETIDELRAEIERLRGADDEAPELRDLPRDDAGAQELRSQLEHQQTHIQELEELLRTAHDDSEALELRVVGNQDRVATLESTLDSRESELEQARAELNILREKAELLNEKEIRVATLDDELSVLRNEMNELLGKSGQYKVLVPELENKLFHRDEQIGALESELEATSYEVVERDRDASDREAQAKYLQELLEAEQVRVASLEADLAATLEKNELLSRDPGTEELHEENLALRKSLREAEEGLATSGSKLDEVQLHRERVDDWNSTVTSLQAEIRRKSTLIDSQADHLAVREQQIELLKVEIEDVRKQLIVRSEETQSLRDLLEQAGSVVVSLSDEVGAQEHADTRLRLAMNPAQDPFGDHEDAVAPIEADIEALRFTARSRRDLADSLENILEEERVALEQASRRVRERDEEVSTLRNELSANRVAMVSLQSRLQEVGSDDKADDKLAMEPARLERELQQSLIVLEAVRADLHKWRGRVKPLHEALVARNERIHMLESEVAVLRQTQGLDSAPVAAGVVDDVTALLDRTRNGETAEDERARTLNEMKSQWDRIVALETDLAETGEKLARVMELDDSRCRQIESLETARSAQLARLSELRTDLSCHGIDPDSGQSDLGRNVVDLGARRPS